MTQTLTIAQLAQFSDAVYGGVGPPAGAGIAGTWMLVEDPSLLGLTSMPKDGFVAQVWKNQTTHEVVIAYRGTVPSNYTTLEQDAYIAVGKLAPGATDAAALALQVQKILPAGYSLAVTGHSLGGYEAQYALTQIVDKGTGAGSPYATVFDAPGLPSTVVAGLAHPSTYYSSINFYAQGDAIHTAGIGAVQLGQLPAVSLSGVGPSISSEFSLAGAAFRLGLLGGLDVAIAAAASTLLYNWAGPAHSRKAILSSLGGPDGANPNGNNVTIGNETEGGYLSGNGATSPDTNLSDAVNGATVIADGTGSSLTVQAPNGSGAVITSVSGVSGDGVLVPVADQSALQAQVAADGSESAASQTLATGIIASLESASRIYITESATSAGVIGVTMGTAPIAGGTDAPGQLTVSNASTNGRFEYGVPAAGQTATETIVGENNQDTVWINTGQTYKQLTGGAISSVASNTWVDANGTQYVYSGGVGGSTGTLTITNGLLGSNTQNSITIQNFNLSTAQGSGGYMGIVLPGNLTLNASANPVVNGAAPNYIEGSNKSYTLSVNAPSATSQTVTVSLIGALPSDFQAIVGNTIEALNPNGTFNVTLAAGETNVAFTLQDVTANDGSSDIANGATLELSASLPNPNTLSGGSISAQPIIFTYIPQGADTAPAPQATSVITGNYNSGTGVTTYSGDGGNDSIVATGASNLVNAQNSGNDIIVGGSLTNTINGSNGNSVFTLNGNSDTVHLGSGFNTVNGSSGHDIIDQGGGDNFVIANSGTDLIVLGAGNSQIYARSQMTLANAIAASSTGTATGQQGDFISVLDGNNTIVGGNGNDLINVGSGNDVIVMGPGNDSFQGGIETSSAVVGWSATVSATNILTEYGIAFHSEYYANPFPQPYNGSTSPSVGSANTTPVSAANDTIFGGKGNEFIGLGNGNNYVETGNGNDNVLGGMGNDTIIAGAGADTIRGGGGTTYIAGGGGPDFLQGGDGNNTIIGGSGNSTILAAYGPSAGYAFSGATLEQNYVFGGSGNDVIQGSAGYDTLIGGTGNVTITGVSGYENITGGNGNDLLNGGSGNNTIAAGGAGRDTLFAYGSAISTSILYGGIGTDYIAGGSGTDVLYAGDGGTAGAATSVFASQTDATALTTIYGGLGVDFLEGGSGAAVIYAGNGGTAASPTSVLASTGSTTIYGGLGTDQIQGGSGADVLYAGDGGTDAAPTSVASGSGVSTLIGGSGSSVLQDITSGQDIVISGTANDTLIGIGNDTLVAGTGSDLIEAGGGAVNVQLNAGFGNDTILTSGGTVNLLLGAGLLATDFTGSVAQDLKGGGLDLTLTGDGGSIAIQNALTGSLVSAAYAGATSISLPTLLADAFGTADQTIPIFSQINSLVGNVIISTANNESLNPGLGSYTVSSWGNNDTINANQSQQLNSYYSAGSGALIYSTGSDSIDAVGLGDTINVSGSNDQITVAGANAFVNLDYNFGGQSFVTVSGLNDTISTGYSRDEIQINNTTTVVQNVFSSAMDISASVSYTLPTGASYLALTGYANISATGNAGLDALTAGAGNDTLIAGSGNATMYGGTGNTTFVVNSGNDLVQDGVSTNNNTVQASVNYTLPTNVNTLVITGTSALVGTANTANDTLISNSGADTLVGGSGNDTYVLNNPNDVVINTGGVATIDYAGTGSYTLPNSISILVLTGTASVSISGNNVADTITSNNGIDTLIGVTGNDTFVVNNPLDVVQDASPTTNNLIQSTVSYSLPTNISTLRLVGTAALSATGNGGPSTLIGNSGNDTLIAGTGLATLVGGSGNTAFVINNTADVIQDTAAGANNTIVSSLNTTLQANVNSLVLTGTGALTGTANSGPDTLTSNSGADTLFGGSGSDTFVVNNTGDMILDTASSVSNSAISSVNYTLPINVNTLLLTGTTALVATGNAANDVLTANTGPDTLVAGAGNDTLVSGSGASADLMIGGAGADLFVVNNSSDIVTVSGAHGADTIQSSVSFTLPTPVNTLLLTGSANLSGAAIAGSNFITGNSGNDVLRAGSGTDTLVAGSAVDTLIGGSGSDTFVVNNAGDVLQGLSVAGNTVVASVSYTMPTNVNVLTLTGTANLSATGNSATDVMMANAGNDTLAAGSGSATFYSGLGSDLFVVNSASDQVLVPNAAIKSGTDTIDSSVSYTDTSVSVLVLTGTSNLSASENRGKPTTLIANAGFDSLTAGTGTDTLIAGAGIATLIGGAGNDTFVVNNTTDMIVDSVSGASNVLLTSVSFSLPTNVNTVALTGSAALTATGNTANDSLVGNAGADTLVAGAGMDTLVAGTGLATLKGGTGSDVFVVNNSGDVIQNASAGGTNLVRSASNYVLPTNVNEIILTGVANISGTGNAASDTLIGGAGNDTLIAGTSANTMIGGLGNTTFVVNSALDVVQDSSVTATNVVQSSVSYSLGNNVNGLYLTGTAALRGLANNANDTLMSNSGADTLVGGAGNEVFIVTNTGDVVQDSASAALNLAEASVNYSLTANVNALLLLGTAALTGTANSANDTLTSNSGIDTLAGGAGNDTFVVNNFLDVVLDTFTTTSNSLVSTVNYTLPVNVNALALAGTGGLVGTGNAASDVMLASSNNDTLIAGSGVATLVGGALNGTFIVNSASDVVQTAVSLANDTLQASVSYTLPSNINTLVLTGSANLVGNANVSGNDVLTANSGNDTLISNNQVDTLISGTGNTVFVLNNLADVVSAGSGNNTIQTSFGYTLPASVANLTLTGTNPIAGMLGSLGGVLTGNAGADTLTGGSGNSTIYGGSGADQILGGKGNDALYAGSGGDSVNATSISEFGYSTSQTTMYGGSGYDLFSPSGPATIVAGSGTGFLNLSGDAYSQTVVLNPGFGTLHLYHGGLQGFNLKYGSGISPTSLGVTAVLDSGSFALQITNGASTFLDDYGFFPTDYQLTMPVEGVTSLFFADSGSSTLAQLIGQAHSTSATLTNGSGQLHFSVGNTDSVTGGSGPDTISAWGNNDTINGGSGREAVYVAGNGDLVNAGAATVATVLAVGAAETLSGGSGTASFFINNTSDVVIQSAANGGVDAITSSVSYSLPSNVSRLNLTGSAALVGTANADTGLSNGYYDSQIFGNSGNDTLVAGAGADDVEAGMGNNLLLGGSGASTLVGRSGISGNDTFVAGNGIAVMEGSAGNDLFVVNNVADRIVTGGGGVDTVQSSVSYSVPLGVSNLVLTGTAALSASDRGDGANAVIIANSGDDSLYAYRGIDTLVAGTGNDFMELGNAADVVQVGASHGNDTIQLDANSSSFSLVANVYTLLILGGADSITGNSGNDSITSHGNNTLVAGSGTDTLVSSYGSDTLVGGGGNDLFIVGGSNDLIVNSSTTTNDTIQSATSFTLPTNINTLILTGASSVVGSGNSANDVLAANSGNVTLVSGSGIDTLIGGGGNDWYVLNNAADVLQSLSTGNNTIQASFSYVLPTNANSLILSGSGNLSGTANAGNDTLTSNAGVDTLIGGSGNDTFVINNLGDNVSDTSAGANNLILSSVTYSLPTNVNRLLLTGTSAAMGTANSANDTLTANSGADTLVSASGTAVDSLVGGTGNDLFVVNVSSDIVNVGSTHGNDTISASVSFNASANVANLIFTGTANVAGTGNSLANIISANSGNDTLTAGSGVATLNGGVGNDVFVLNNIGDLVQNASASSLNIVRASVSYSLITNINTLILTGTSALKGIANTANDTLTSNTGVDTLVGGTGSDVFVVSNSSDVVQDTSSTANNTVQSSVAFSLPTYVNTLGLTGTTAVVGRGNAGNDLMTANTGADTLIAGNGADTLVSSSSGTAIDSLVGGTGNDVFIINYAGDIVNATSHGVDTIQSSVSYTDAANVAYLVLTGTAALLGTGNSTSSQIVANSGADTLTAGSAVTTLVGGSGNDTFVVNLSGDVVLDSVTSAFNVLSSSISFTLPTNVNRLILSGTSALVGTANAANDTLAANSGADTLVSGTGVDSLLGGTGANLFIVNNAADIVTVGATHGVDTIQSSVSYTASANVANLTLTGTADLLGVGSSLAGIINANSGNDTLMAGSGADTLVGGTGTDTFIVNSALDVVSLATSGTSDTLQSSAPTYTLPMNVQYLMLTGTAALAGTGNSLLDLIVGNTANDTLTGGTGIAALEGGKISGSDQIRAPSAQAALVAGGGSSTLTGGAFKDFYAAGMVSDSITTGATANVISVNKGDGATALQPTTGASNVLSLGAGIDTENLKFTKTGNNLILTDGVSGDSITFTNWYAAAANQVVTTLQVVEIASASYNSSGSDALRNKPLEAFNFTTLVNAFNTAGSPANWALSTAMPSAALATTATADYGGDLAYYYGLNGNLTGVNLASVQSTLTNASYATSAQTIDAFSSISGGGGLHLLKVNPAAGVPSNTAGVAALTPPAASIISTTPAPSTSAATDSMISSTVTPSPVPELQHPIETPVRRGFTPRIGIEPANRTVRVAAYVTAADAFEALPRQKFQRTLEPIRPAPTSDISAKSYVDPVNVAWLTLHGNLDQSQQRALGGMEVSPVAGDTGSEALLSGTPLNSGRRIFVDPDFHAQGAHRQAL